MQHAQERKTCNLMQYSKKQQQENIHSVEGYTVQNKNFQAFLALQNNLSLVPQNMRILALLVLSFPLKT